MNFIHKLPKSSKTLSCTLISLNNWKLTKITGKNAIQYLQGQLTCNLQTINKNQYTFAAHCNPYGKVINNMYVFYVNSEIALIQRDEICNKQIITLKKYAIFSNVMITIEKNIELFGVAGKHAREKLKNVFHHLPNKENSIVCNNTGIIILHVDFPQERFLLVIPKNHTKNILKILTKNMNVHNHLQWTSLDIEAGYPIINIETSEKFIPQALNLHILHAISFDKGCYVGQETIARAKYTNFNKRALYWLIGENNNKNNLPKINDNLEIKIHEYWRPIGTILASCQIDTGEIWIQAVLHQNISNNNQFRIKNEANNIFKISFLPYSIT